MSTISASTTSTTAYKVTADTTGTLVLQTGSTPTTAVTIDTSQNMGLGVTPSAWYSSYKALQVKTSSLAAWGNNEVYLMSNAYGDTSSSYKYLATGSKATAYVQYEGTHLWYTAGTGTAGNAITFTQPMTLNASGFLGIGQTSPTYSVDILADTGNLLVHQTRARVIDAERNIGGIAGSGYSTGTTIVDSAQIVFASTGAWSSTSAPSYISFGTTSSGATTLTERARITSGGYSKFSNIGSYTNASGTFHEFNNNVSGDWGLVVRSTTSSTPYGIDVYYSAVSPNNTGSHFFYAEDSTAQRFSVRSNGGIANYSANDVNLSDRREKTNFAPAGDYLAKICAIPVQTFNYIDQNLEEDDGLTLGVVAQDVQAVAPELVMETNWAKSDEEPKMRLSIYQTDLQYALMKCIQEQQAIIETLTNRITALEAK